VATPPRPSARGKGKAVRVVASDNEVSSDDDAPLQGRLRLIHNTGSAVGGPTLAEPRVLEVTVLGVSSGSNPAAVDTATTEKAVADKEFADAAVAKKVADDVVAAAAKVVVDKEAADAAKAKKVADDIVAAAVKAAADKEAADAAAAKKAADDSALTKGMPEETTGGSVDPDTTPTPAVGTKRHAAQSSSSLSAKRPFRGPGGLGLLSIP
jgi:hypothetical protein